MQVAKPCRGIYVHVQTTYVPNGTMDIIIIIAFF
jgi:hypothetical protein